MLCTYYYGDTMIWNESVLNMTNMIDFQNSVDYVTVISCKTAMAQTEFWMYTLGVLFLVSWVCFCYVLKKYLKIKNKL